jgi:predicted phosphodiesterase
MSISERVKELPVSAGLLTSPAVYFIVASVVFIMGVGGCGVIPLFADTQTAHARITKGPVLLRVYQDRASVMWETDTQRPGRLCYGKHGNLDKYVESTARQIQYQPKGGGKRTAFIHKVWLDDLEADQDYNYRIACPQIQSKIHQFHTTPTETDEVKFIVYGDSRSNPTMHRKLVKLMMKQKVDFLVHTGDLVTSGDRYEQWGPQFFEPLKGLAETVPIYIAKGNHEGNGGNYEKLLIPPGGRNSFGFDYGPVHYFCVDNVSRGLKADEQLRQIAADARDSQALWKFVSYHVPSVNFGGHWSTWGYPDALPTLAEAGVAFVMVGHSHQYERFRPVAPPSVTDGSYVTYITTGGGGAPLSGVDPILYHAYAKKIHHFCLFHIQGDRLTMDAIDIDGKAIDHLEIDKSRGRLNKQYLSTAVPMEAIRLHQELYSASLKPLSTRPQKNQPFTVACTLSVPELNEAAKMTFSLRCDKGTYELPEAEVVTVAKQGGTVDAELTVTPLVEVRVPKDSRGRARPIEPALWLDYHYEIGQIKQTISKSVMAKARRD